MTDNFNSGYDIVTASRNGFQTKKRLNCNNFLAKTYKVNYDSVKGNIYLTIN